MSGAPRQDAALAYLAVANVDSAADFYARAFGGMVTKRAVSSEGLPVYAEMTFESGAVVLIGRAGGNPLCPATAQGHGAVYLWTPDLEGLAQRAVFAGAALLREIREEPWGDRVAVLRDLDGNRWFWAQPVGDGR